MRRFFPCPSARSRLNHFLRAQTEWLVPGWEWARRTPCREFHARAPGPSSGSGIARKRACRQNPRFRLPGYEGLVLPPYFDSEATFVSCFFGGRSWSAPVCRLPSLPRRFETFSRVFFRTSSGGVFSAGLPLSFLQNGPPKDWRMPARGFLVYPNCSK